MSKKLRRVKAKLERRRANFDRIRDDRRSGYRKPGSMNRRKA